MQFYSKKNFGHTVFKVLLILQLQVIFSHIPNEDGSPQVDTTTNAGVDLMEHSEPQQEHLNQDELNDFNNIVRGKRHVNCCQRVAHRF